MKLARLFILIVATTCLAHAGEPQPAPAPPRDWWGTQYKGVPAPVEKFSAGETSIDAFATYAAAQTQFSHLFQTDIRDGDWGGGAGLNYFFTRILGVGGEVLMSANGGNFVDSVSASAIGRLPIDSVSLAPYAFAGVGRRTDGVWEWTQHVGVGLEYRLNRETGLFVDSRYEWADKTSDRVVFRAGLRLVF